MCQDKTKSLLVPLAVTTAGMEFYLSAERDSFRLSIQSDPLKRLVSPHMLSL